MSKEIVVRNRYLNTQNFLFLTLLAGVVVEGISVSNKRWGGSISRNISKGLKIAGPIGVAAVSFLFGHWIDDADPKD